MTTKPIAPYLGGKSKLAKTICGIIDDTEHKIYAEPFVGMGGILFRKQKPAKSEIVNDYNYDVFTLFRVLQRHYDEFIKQLEFTNHSRNHFKYIKSLEPKHLTDIERACRFYYLLRTSFGAKGGSYGVDKSNAARFNIDKYKVDLAKTVNRLRSVALENLDFEAFINKYDSKDTLFYLDPPYYGNEKDYGKDLFNRVDFERLRNCLDNIKGKFVLSLNDVEQVRDIFKGYEFKNVELTYSVNKDRPKKAKEVIITNYKV